MQRIDIVMTTALRKKLNARGRHQLAEGAFKGEIEALVRTEKPPSPQQQEELQEAGYSTHFIAGNVLSGAVVDAAHLEEVAKLPFVCKIELSSPMFEESPK